jgi:hypothetical protein
MIRILKIVQGRAAVSEAIRNLACQGFETSFDTAVRGPIKIRAVSQDTVEADYHKFAGLQFDWIDFTAYVSPEARNFLLALVRWPNEQQPASPHPLRKRDKDLSGE